MVGRTASARGQRRVAHLEVEGAGAQVVQVVLLVALRGRTSRTGRIGRAGRRAFWLTTGTAARQDILEK